MDRREFLQGAAVGAASLALGMWRLRPRDAAAETANPSSLRMNIYSFY